MQIFGPQMEMKGFKVLEKVFAPISFITITCLQLFILCDYFLGFCETIDLLQPDFHVKTDMQLCITIFNYLKINILNNTPT